MYFNSEACLIFTELVVKQENGNSFLLKVNIIN